MDDGSTDGSADVIRAIGATDVRVRLLRFAANAGLRAAQGQIVVTMDSDLQSDPVEIPRLLARLDHWDAACGWRRAPHDPWLKRVSSRVANRVRAAVLDDSIHDSACSLRARHRRCVESLDPFQGFHRFVPSLLRQAGHRVIEVPVNHRPRRFGTSHFGVRNRAWRGVLDLFAVRWMQSHRLRYETVETSPPAP